MRKRLITGRRLWLTISLFLVGLCPLLRAQVPGDPVKLGFSVQPPNTVIANSAFSVTVAVQDKDGLRVTTADYEVELTIETDPTGGLASLSIFPAATNPKQTTVSGVTTFSNLRIDRSGQQFRLRATAIPTALQDPLTAVNSQYFDVMLDFRGNLQLSSPNPTYGVPAGSTYDQAREPSTAIDSKGNVWAVWIAPRNYGIAGDPVREEDLYDAVWLARRGDFGWETPIHVGNPKKLDRARPRLQIYYNSLGADLNSIWVACQEDYSTAGGGWEIFLYKAEYDYDSGKMKDWNTWMLNNSFGGGNRTDPKLQVQNHDGCYVTWLNTPTEGDTYIEVGHITRQVRGFDAQLPRGGGGSVVDYDFKYGGPDDGGIQHQPSCKFIWTETNGNAGTTSLYALQQWWKDCTPRQVRWDTPHLIFNEALNSYSVALSLDDQPTDGSVGQNIWHLVWANDSDTDFGATEIWFGTVNAGITIIPCSPSAMTDSIPDIPYAETTIVTEHPTALHENPDIVTYGYDADVRCYVVWEEQLPDNFPDDGVTPGRNLRAALSIGGETYSDDVQINDDSDPDPAQVLSPITHVNPEIHIEQGDPLKRPYIIWEDGRLGRAAIFSTSAWPRLVQLGEPDQYNPNDENPQTLTFQDIDIGYHIQLDVPAEGISGSNIIDLYTYRAGNPPTPQNGIVRPVFYFGPRDIVFNQAATVTIRIPVADYRDYANCRIWWWSPLPREWQEIPDCTRVVGANDVTYTFQTTVWSGYYGIGGADIDYTLSTLTAETPVTIDNDGDPVAEGSTVTVTLLTSAGDPIPAVEGAECAFTALSSAGTAWNPAGGVGVGRTDANGQLSVVLASDRVDTKEVSCTVTGEALAATAMVTFTEPPSFTLTHPGGETSYHLISVPMSALRATGVSLDNASDLAAYIGAACRAVWQYDEANQNWGAGYIVGLPGTDFALTAGQAYMISLDASATVAFDGTWTQNLTFSLVAGYNLVSVPASQSGTIVDVNGLVNDVPGADAAWVWRAASQSWVIYIKDYGPANANLPLAPGDAVMVHVNTGGNTWPVASQQ